MKNKLLLLLLFVFFTHLGYSQTYTSIPDPNFENALENLGYDNIPNDGQVLTADIETIIDLDISNQNIADLTGIEAFRDLMNLNLNDNSVTDLDLTGISNLMTIEAMNNGINMLNVSTHSNLDQLLLNDNNLSSLDISNNTNLNRLLVDNNNLNMLDVSNTTNLVELSVQNNSLTSINLSTNTQLQIVTINNNNLMSIDLTNNTNLSQVFLNNNMLTELDVSTLFNLNTLEVDNNILTILNLKNGNTNNITNLNFDGNPNLICILVDDATYAENNFSNGNPNTFFTETSCYTAIPDANFEAALSSYDDIPNDGQVPTGLIFQVADVNITNASIQDLTGIEAFEALLNLTINGNSIANLDLSNNTQLQNLEAQNCGIQTINIAGLTNLSQLILPNNALTSLDLTTSTGLSIINLNGNNLTSLNLKNGTNGAIGQLDVRSNPNLYCVLVNDINLPNNPNVLFDSQTGFTTESFCRYTAIPDANFEARLNTLGYDDTPNDGQVPTALIEVVTTLDLMDASITYLTGIEYFTALLNLTIDGNNLITLDLSNNAQLQFLQAIDCNIQNINITGLTNLTQLILQFNALTSLDLSTNTALSSINVSSNDLSYLNLQNGNNASITLLDVRSNSNLECVLLNDLNVLTTATVYNNPQTNYTTTQYCEYTSIPDDSFEAALYVLGYDDFFGDAQVPTDLIENLTELDVRGSLISDLTGIEDFISLTELDISNNNLTTISLTTLTNLKILDAQSNIALTNLDVSGNTQLEQLIVEDCSALTTLDLSTNILLEILFANQTNLSSITFGNLTNLSNIDFDGANFISLDVSALTALTSLDVSGNQLISLNIANGNNTNFTNLDARNNTNLRCIAVDDPAFATANFTNIDVQTSFRQTSCYTAIPDANFEAALTALDYDDIANDGRVPKRLIEVVTSLDVNSKAIADLTGIEDFTALTFLNVNNNQLTSIDVTALTNLEGLLVSTNNLTSIDLSTLTQLTRFQGRSNLYTSLDFSNNVLLDNLNVDTNANLSSINISQNPLIDYLDISECAFTSLDISDLTNLTRLDIANNNISSIDFTNNTALEDVFVSNNPLGSIDVSNLTSLTDFYAINAQLSSLNVRNGNNTNFDDFNVTNNPNLTCILVDDAAFAGINFTDIDATANFTSTDYCEYTAIPDANFEAALEYLGYDDITGDGQVPTALIESVTNLSVESMNISDLTGIEDFVALEVLNYDSNSVLTVDLSNNTALRILYARSNGINSIDVSANTNLRLLFLTFNNLTSIDVSSNVNLTSLWVQDNLLTGIDISNNPNLINFGISNNQVTNLDLSNNVNLVNLFAANNNLVTMDLSLNSALVEIGLASNNLESVDVRNGNNTIITKFNVQFNPNLTCVFVDDAAYSTANWDEIDAQTNFTETEYCRYTAIPDAFFENALNFFGYDDIADDGQVPTELIETVVTLEMINNGIADLTGIEDFAALEELNIAGNSIDILDLSANTNLIKVNCEANGINTINLTGLTALEEFIGRFNGYTALDVSTNTSLITLYCNNTDLTSLDVSNLTALTDLNCSVSYLTSLNVRNGNNTNFTNFNATNNPNLTCISVDDAAFAGINFTNVDATASFTETDYCRYTATPDPNFEAALETLGYDDISADGQVPTTLIENVTTLDVGAQSISDFTGLQDFVSLEVLDARNNLMSSIDLTNLTQLRDLELRASPLTSLDLSANVLLERLDLEDAGSFSTLDVSTNTLLEEIDATDIGFTDFIFTSLNNIKFLAISDNALTALDFSTTSMDSLEILALQNNNLSSLNLKNGDNAIIQFVILTGNANLTCVIVDDVAYSSNNWTSIDAQTNFTETQYCEYTAIPDTNFEAALDYLGYDDISGDGQVPTELIQDVEELNVRNMGISSLVGIEDFTALQRLNIRENNISQIDLSNNTALTNLDGGENQLTALDITNNPAIVDLRVWDNQIPSIDLSNQVGLRILQINNNNLQAIDVSNNPLLERFRVYYNNINAIDLTNNPVLSEITVQYNQLEVLDIRSGGNTNVSDFRAVGNLNLTCIQVDNAAYSTTNWTNIDAQTRYTETGYCDYTAIPDINFEAALEGLGYDDISADGQVPTALIETVTTLIVENANISDITGIEDFTMLEVLNIRNNNVTTMDISQNTELLGLNAVSNNLTALDITNNPLLDDLRVEVNALTTIDLSNQPDLKILQINNNQLTTIDVSNNPLIERFRVNNNNITAIDLSINTVIKELRVESNQLEVLNVQNGGNTNISNFGAFGNPNLTCILVDDAAYSTTNWTGIDATTSFSDTYCRYTAIPDANFEAALEALGYDDITGDGQVPTALIENITSLNIQGQSISDITGIEDFTALGTLRCTNNSITAFDLSTLTNLAFLWCNQNQLTALDLSNNTALTFVSASENAINSFNGTGLNQVTDLSIWSNQLSSIDLSDMTALTEVDLFGNMLTSIDVSNNTALQDINIRNNSITTLDLSNNAALTIVDARQNDLMSFNMKNGNNTNITNFRATSNPNLTCILVDDVTYSTTNWTNIDPQTSFSDTVCTTDYTVAIKVYLQGASLNPNSGEETLMRDDLRVANYIPTRSPYADMLNCEATVFNTTGPDAIVDWVWVELRSATDNTSVSFSRSALLQRDGDVVDVDGTSPLTFTSIENSFYIAIHHRNHLGIISNTAITLTSDVDTSIDFTNNSIATFGISAQTTSGLPTGLNGLWCGNVNEDTVVQYSGTSPDTPAILSEILNDAGNFLNFPTYSITAYNVNDANMDGIIQYSGTDPDTPFILQNVLAHPGNFLNFSTYQIIEQLPENISNTSN